MVECLPNRNHDGSVLMDQRWLQWVNKLLPRLMGGNLYKRTWLFDHLGAANRIKTATDSLDLIGRPWHQARQRWTSNVQVRGFRTFKKVQTRGQWKAFIVVKHDKAAIWPRQFRNKLETPAQRVEVLSTKRFQVQRFGKKSPERLKYLTHVQTHTDRREWKILVLSGDLDEQDEGSDRHLDALLGAERDAILQNPDKIVEYQPKARVREREKTRWIGTGSTAAGGPRTLGVLDQAAR